MTTLVVSPGSISLTGGTITPRYGVPGVAGGTCALLRRVPSRGLALRLLTAPLVEPLTVAEAKARCNITSSDDDAIVAALIVSARKLAEAETGRALIAQVWVKTFDAFPTATRLEWPPLLSIDAVEYREAVAGAWTTLSAAAYIVDNASEPGFLQPAYGYEWPQTWPEINSVKVTYSAGYGSAADDVPQAIKDWMSLMIGHYYKNREASDLNNLAALPFIGGLLDDYRVWSFG